MGTCTPPALTQTIVVVGGAAASTVLMAVAIYYMAIMVAAAVVVAVLAVVEVRGSASQPAFCACLAWHLGRQVPLPSSVEGGQEADAPRGPKGFKNSEQTLRLSWGNLDRPSGGTLFFWGGADKGAP